MRYVTSAKGEKVVISRSGEVLITDDHGRERERHKVPYGAMLSVDEGKAVKAVPSWQPGIRTPVRSLPNMPVLFASKCRRGRYRRQAG
jgi:hypothetical protein